MMKPDNEYFVSSKFGPINITWEIKNTNFTLYGGTSSFPPPPEIEPYIQRIEENALVVKLWKWVLFKLRLPYVSEQIKMKRYKNPDYREQP